MRRRIPLMTGWRFHRGDPADWNQSGFANHKFPRVHLMKAAAQGLARADHEVAHWRQVDLPHDFVIEGRYEPSESSDHGCLAVGPAWYRRSFRADRVAGERVWLVFDGVYRDAQVWVDGWRAGAHSSGYLGFRLDVTDLLEGDGEHVVAVRVDASQREGWWYEGGGIYRPVHLEIHADRAIAADGVYARCAGTVRSGAPCTLLVDTEVRDWRAVGGRLAVRTVLHAADGTVLAADEVPVALAASATAIVAQRLEIAAARVWSPDDPHLCTVVSELLDGATVIDRHVLTTGLRSVAMDSQRGFLLNGEPLQLRGFCCHQDLAGAGVALTGALHAYKLERLRWMGANAYRSAHHPAAPELLDAADRLGVIVMAEHRLPGFDDEAMGLFAAMIRRDRSRACVGIWSLFNEEMDLQVRDTGGRLVARMSALAQALDGTRPVTAAVNFALDGQVGRALPVLGFNYQHRDYDTWRAANPGRPALGSETCCTCATRGVHDPAGTRWQGLLRWPLETPAPPSRRDAHVLADGTTWPNWGCPAWEAWTAVRDRPWLGGTFVWTGFDYYGETIPLNAWPAVSTNVGTLDLGGLPKDHAWYYRAAWRREPSVRLGGHWSWHGREGAPVPLRIYHNGDVVELWCNGRLVERIAACDEPPLREVVYEPGWIEARCLRAGAVVAVHRHVTAGPPAGLRIDGARTLRADGLDAAVLHIAVVDAAGTEVPGAEVEVAVAVDGPLRLLGGHNGDPCDHAAPTDASRRSWAGWLSVAVRSVGRAGEARVIAASPGLAAAEAALRVVP